MQIVRTFREGEFDDLMRRTEPKVSEEIRSLLYNIVLCLTDTANRVRKQMLVLLVF